MIRTIPLIFSVLLAVSHAFARDIHVIIDPGHGGPADWGFTTTGFDEKTLDLSIAKKVQSLLEAEGDYEVQYPDSIFISIHSTVYEKEPHVFTYVLRQTPSSGNSILSPIETVHSKSYKNSLKLAQIMDDEFPENMNHEIVLPKFPIASLIGVQSTAVLVECQCVSSNAQSTEANLDEFSRNLVESISAFVKKVM